MSLDTSDGATHINDMNGLGISANDSESFAQVAHYLDAIAGGAVPAKIRLNYGATQATGTITFSSFADADTITVNGVTLTGKTTPSGASQWAVGATDEACANNLVALINASALASIVGCVGATRRATVTVAAMVDGDTVTINGVVFTCKASPSAAVREQFQLGTSDTVTASNLKNAVNKSINVLLAGIVATSATTIVTLNFIGGALTVANSAHGTVASTIVVMTCIIAGTLGNLSSLAISAHGSVSAALMTGGAEGTEVIFAKNWQAV